MSENARPLGAPTWLDLTVQDVEGAKVFYGDLFGWEFTDLGEDFAGYTIIQKDGNPVGALAPAMDADGNPAPMERAVWSIYLSTHDIEDTIARVRSAGGELVMGPMRVEGSGHMAMINTPSGAHIGLWQSVEFNGFQLPLAPGTSVWFEAMTSDFDADLAFYRDALGWEIAWMGPEGGSDGFKYVTNGAGDKAVAGMCDAQMFFDDGRSYWRPYFMVEDTAAAVKTLESAGGRVTDGPEDSEFGRITTVVDPWGATFQLQQPL